MAHTLSAQKRMRQNEKRRVYNKSLRTKVKTALKIINQNIKQFESSPEGETKIEPGKIKESLSKTYSVIDKALKAGVIHKNKAARLKSRVTLLANKLVKQPDKPAKEAKAKKSKKAK